MDAKTLCLDVSRQVYILMGTMVLQEQRIVVDWDVVVFDDFYFETAEVGVDGA